MGHAHRLGAALEDASLPLLYHGAKKSKMTKNSNQGGVTGILKHVKSSVARSGGIVLRWSSGYGAGG